MFNTLYIEKTQNTLIIHYTYNINVKKIFLGQNKRYRECHLFLFASSNISQYHFSFAILTCVSCVSDFLFSIPFCFYYSIIFVQQNAWALWLWNVIISFKIKIIEKPQIVLLPDLWFLSYNKKFFILGKSFQNVSFYK